MKQQAIERDNAAIEDALSGWWQQSMENRDEKMQWWREARFGMFLHWGVYTVAGAKWKDDEPAVYSEHLMRHSRIPKKDYVRELVQKFDPVDFDADRWVQYAQDTGMKYIVVLAKHHDGLALYPSKVNGYNITLTGYKGDPIGELQQSCRKRGIKFGLYYSQAWDWEDKNAPGNDWDYKNPGGNLNLYAAPGEFWHMTSPELVEHIAREYVDKKAIAQIQEIMEWYHPDILWFDTPSKLPLSENLRILKMVRQKYPEVIVNSRITHDEPRVAPYRNFADYLNTADRPAEVYPADGDWEAIPTTNESYGYSAYDTAFKEASFFTQLLADTVAKGGNLLMNIGPMPSGLFHPTDVKILQGIERWMKKNSESIYGCGVSGLPAQVWGSITRKGRTLYLHVKGQYSKIILSGMINSIESCQILGESTQVPFRRITSFDHELLLPDMTGRVIQVKVKGELQTHDGILLSNGGSNRLHVFDAHLTNGLRYGEGKVNKDYICYWNKRSQTVSWKIRVPHSMKYRMTLNYLAYHTEGVKKEDNLERMHAAGGSYRIAVGDREIHAKVHLSKEPIPQEDSFKVTLLNGEHDIMIIPEEITGLELMKLYQVCMVPVEEVQAEAGISVDNTDTGISI